MQIGKVLQYSYKYLAWRAGEAGEHKLQVSYSKISGTMSLGRKMFRLGYWIGELKKFAAQMESKPRTTMEILATLRVGISTIYWLMDNIYWMHKMEIVIGDTNRVNRYRIFFWLLTVLLSVPPTASAYVKARNSVKKDIPKTHVALNHASADMVRIGADLLVSSSYAINAQVIPALYTTHEGLIGLAGVASGVAGFFNVWTK